ncbi:GNAT family N-acetyltransferase, partial [Klebsiella pneumoniae]|nr:GNAT family N-acetyltransferase [Klebsiella pneumoniae]
MPELLTPRLRCSPLQLDDWSFFLSLQQDPQVMLYVADPRPQAAIR